MTTPVDAVADDDPHAVQLRADLEAAGRRLAAADAERAAAMDQVQTAIRAAGDVLPVLHMAQLAGVSRVTAYRLLEQT